jgi:hypothetical protein
MMSSLTLKRARIEQDYDVLGKIVGRIYVAGSRFDPPELRWFWSLMATPATPGVTNGHAPTREEAMAEFRDA